MFKKQFLLFFLIFLISLLFIGKPLWAGSCRYPRSSLKSCDSNQRVLEGCIQMYNLDHKEQIKTALPGGDYEELENKLIQEKYLKEPLEEPEDDCSYGYIKYSADDDIVFCKLHGSVELNNLKSSKDLYWPIPTYDKSKEKPFSNYYLSKRAKNVGSRRSKEAINKLNTYWGSIFFGLLHYMPYIMFFLLIITFFIGFNKKKKKQN